MTSAWRLAAALASAALFGAGALLAGCSKSSGSAAGSSGASSSFASSSFADCTALTSAPLPDPSSDPSSPPAAPAAGTRLPDLELPCFAGAQTVNIGQIKGPAVINLWASWCAPCRAELPAFQRLAGRAGGRVHVIGVVTYDERDAAQSLASDLGVSFPTIYDQRADLLARLGKAGLPATLFIDAGNRISYLYNSGPLDDAALIELVNRHLGLTVQG